MKKKKICWLALCFTFALALSACIFESDENGLESWLSDQGMPSSYKVQALTIEGLKPVSAEAFMDSLPNSADIEALIGRKSNLSHDLVLDFAFRVDSSFSKKMADAENPGAYMTLFWLRKFYENSYFPKDGLPLEENLEINISWILDTGSKKSFLDSLADINDSVWYNSLLDWQPMDSADTVVSINLPAGDTSAFSQAVVVPLPTALLESLKKVVGPAHLQLRISAPKTEKLYRFYGDATDYSPKLGLYIDSLVFLNPPPEPYHMANVVKSEEECPECLVLHGGVHDSIVVELPSEPILKALSDFYGDEFPYTKGDGVDARQTVIHAQLTMARDDSKGANEFGLPIQVVTGSIVDSMISDSLAVIRRMETYSLNEAEILESGHQNFVFHDGDSLTLQIPSGVRDFVNKASDGRSIKFMFRLGMSFVQEKDTTYSKWIAQNDTVITVRNEQFHIAKGDTAICTFPYYDYSRYDFTKSMENPMTLKLWLASKRGNK